jgi:hypothetical protein
MRDREIVFYHLTKQGHINVIFVFLEFSFFFLISINVLENFVLVYRKRVFILIYHIEQ